MLKFPFEKGDLGGFENLQAKELLATQNLSFTCDVQI